MAKSALHIFPEEGIDSIEPKCSHFGACGGCKFQHIPYNVQLLQKENFVSHCFGKEVDPIIPCDSPWHYRNKMEFSFNQAKSGEKFLGLMRKRGRVENLNECYLTHPWFLEVLRQVREWWAGGPLTAYHPMTNTGLLRTLTLREGVRTNEKMVVLTVSEEAIGEEEIKAFVETLPSIDAVILRRQIIKKKTPTRFEETILSGKDYIHDVLYDAADKAYTFRIKAASFFQPNTLQAEIIYQKVAEFADLQGNEFLLDLFCGTGSIGIFLANHAERVLGVELIPEAVEDAQINLTLNQINNMKVVAKDVGALLEQLEERPDIVVVDPPRAGLGPNAIAHLQRLNPKKIIYVSCNPVTQAADCQALGYQIERLQPIDQFPHTPHVENIALLT